MKCLQFYECKAKKPSLRKYFKAHEDICTILQDPQRIQFKKEKRSIDDLDVTPQFASLWKYKNYFIESKVDDFR